jgi:hypothetical protein
MGAISFLADLWSTARQRAPSAINPGIRAAVLIGDIRLREFSLLQSGNRIHLYRKHNILSMRYAILVRMGEAAAL